MTAAKLRNYLVQHKLKRVVLIQQNLLHLLTEEYTVTPYGKEIKGKLIDGVFIDNLFCPFGHWLIVHKDGKIESKESLTDTEENLLNK